MAEQHLDDAAIAQTAADWIVRLSADTEPERQAARCGFETWKRAHPAHAEAAADMERFVEQTQRLRGDAPAHAALQVALQQPAPIAPAAQHGRTAALLLAVALLATWLPTATPRQWLADLRTAVGEQRSQQLADGTTLTLSTDSAVNYQLGADLRRVELLGGEILLDVARDASRPLVVDTPQGRIRALGTRFIVRREAQATVLTMLESSTAVRLSQAPAAAAEHIVDAGQQVRLSAQGVERLPPVNPGLLEHAFKHRRLAVQDRPLAEVLDELARQRHGLIRYAPADLQGIRVTAVLPLDDTDRALQLLAASFPQLSVRNPTRWLVLVEARR